MGRRPTKAADNPFCRARLEAAKYNEKLYSKEGAAELLGVSVSTLSDYELGLTKVIPPDMVVKMAELYNAPELENYYCTEMCPLGCEMQKVSIEDLDRISIRVFAALRKLGGTGELLLEIAEDGIVSEDERPDMQRVLESLGELEAVTQNLKLWAKKNL
ncbi:XRE family transcriptional regulator [Petralouisia muris]|uniref:XRE family transcriptional regulator n=1 Tax=Petralouisia muris TaxID=3032872 RepID=A0AC61RPC5_9FIRM|nr:helix-turn-helix transcriptional regulator [Petralouisia muris]TGY90885.1 XRE family transcriptional regulator [Petralouisia muris]